MEETPRILSVDIKVTGNTDTPNALSPLPLRQKAGRTYGHTGLKMAPLCKECKPGHSHLSNLTKSNIMPTCIQYAELIQVPEANAEYLRQLST